MTQERPASSLPGETTSVAEPAAAEQPVAAGAKVDPEAARLTARASILLAREALGQRGSCLSALPRWAARRPASRWRKRMILAFYPVGGLMGTRGDAAKAPGPVVGTGGIPMNKGDRETLQRRLEQGASDCKPVDRRSDAGTPTGGSVSELEKQLAEE